MGFLASGLGPINSILVLSASDVNDERLTEMLSHIHISASAPVEYVYRLGVMRFEFNYATGAFRGNQHTETGTGNGSVSSQVASENLSV